MKEGEVKIKSTKPNQTKPNKLKTQMQILKKITMNIIYIGK